MLNLTISIADKNVINIDIESPIIEEIIIYFIHFKFIRLFFSFKL